MPKGHKRTKGIPELHDELKARVTLALTPTAVQGLDSLAEKLEVSRSELVEQIGRGEIQLCRKRTLDSVNPTVQRLLEKAIRKLREPTKVTTMTPSLNMALFSDRDKLPNAPGCYIITDLIAEYYGSTLDLRRAVTNEDLINSLTYNFPENLDEDCFILWMVCQRYDALPYIRKQLQSFFFNLQNDIWLEQLSMNIAKQSTSEPFDEISLEPKVTLIDLTGIFDMAMQQRSQDD